MDETALLGNPGLRHGVSAVGAWTLPDPLPIRLAARAIRHPSRAVLRLVLRARLDIPGIWRRNAFQNSGFAQVAAAPVLLPAPLRNADQLQPR